MGKKIFEMISKVENFKNINDIGKYLQDIWTDFSEQFVQLRFLFFADMRSINL